MQTIDSIRRTNELSKVLKKHGFAQDSFEAVSKAQDATSSDQDSSTSTIYDASSTSHQQSSESSGSERFSAKIATLERSKHLLSGRVDSLQKELQSTQEYVKQLVARLERAESKLRQQPQQFSQPAAQGQPQASVQQSQQTSEPQQAVPEQKEKKVDPAVSIENVFNYSGK